jgi:ABC-type lipoprotein release transport system permease subunit
MMSFRRLLWANLFYHWRGNLAVFLGVAVGTAVLTGALLVGDSLRGSLRDLTLRQLSWVDHALISQRFVQEELADKLEAEGAAERACPAILLQGSASTRFDRRVGRVSILGVTERFWLSGNLPVEKDFWLSNESSEVDGVSVVLNQTLAELLQVREGDILSLHFQKISALPRESLLGQRDASKVLADFPLRVAAVLPQDFPGADFSLQPLSVSPRNAFVPLRLLQAKLERDARRDGTNLDLQNRINVLLARGKTAELDKVLQENIPLDDWGLILHDPQSRTQDLFARLARKSNPDQLAPRDWKGRVAVRFAQEVDRERDGSKPIAASHPEPVLTRAQMQTYFRHQGYLSLESRQLLLEAGVVKAALAAAQETGLRAAPTLTYLADSISAGEVKASYAIVAALDPTLKPPLGPFLPPGVEQLNDQDILLSKALQPLLSAHVGDQIRLNYYDPEDQDQLRSAEFRLAGFLPLQGVAADPFLTPEFPGITDKTRIDQWDPPPQIHFNNRRIKKPDDEIYWEQFRTTPKAYVTLKRGLELWGKSRFGQFTSIRLAPESTNGNNQPADLQRLANDFRQSLLHQLSSGPERLEFDPVAERRLAASSSGTDFGVLFLGFSFFLIVAALLLVGLLFRLNLERRANEVGILLASGFRRGKVRSLLGAEGVILAAGGGLAGLMAAAAYAGFLIRFLRARWPGGLDQSFFRLHLFESHGFSYLIGYLSILVVSVLTVFWTVRIFGRTPPRSLLTGQTGTDSIVEESRRRLGPMWRVGAGLAIAALGIIGSGRLVRGEEMQAMTFFTGGGLLLSAFLLWTWAYLRRDPTGRQGFFGLGNSSPFRRVARLGVRNSSRHAVRSLLTAGLLACAVFLVIAVQSFHREPEADFSNLDSGSGGCSLLAEADVPIYQDLNNDAERRDQLNFPDSGTETLRGVTFFPFRLRAGDDASCLNLSQPRRPRLLGAPDGLIRRGGFRFAATQATSAEQRANPWLLLEQTSADGAVPVFADDTAAEWTLHKKLGEVFEIPDEQAAPNDRGERVLRLSLVGLLKDSVFQSELLLSERNFLRLYPRQEGYSFFLISAPADRLESVKTLLAAQLAPRGFEVSETKDRLRSYLAVENTYLATFQALGGLGLLLGALGLAVVLLRGVWERRGELALLKALGYRNRALAWLVLAENGFLLILGLGVGTTAALLAVLPHLLGRGETFPWRDFLGLLGLVLAVGLLAEAAAVAATLRAPLVPALRRE